MYNGLKKCVVFVLYNIIPRDDKEGYLLLKCIHSFVELHAYTSLEAHTTCTIAAGREELQHFGTLMEVCFSFLHR